MRRLLVLLSLPVMVALPVDGASATWSGLGAGRSYAKAGSLGAGQRPSTVVNATGPTSGSATTGRDVVVSWEAAANAASYTVSGAAGSGCTGFLAGLTCIDSLGSATPTLAYSVTPRLGAWSGSGSPTPAPGAVDLVLKNNSNGAQSLGRPEPGDTIVITFSADIDPVSVCASWGGASRPITATLENGSAGATDRFVFSDGSCTLNIGTIVLGSGSYVMSNLVFPSTIALSARTLTITLGGNGQASRVQCPTAGCPVASYVPASGVTTVGSLPVLGTITKSALNF